MALFTIQGIDQAIDALHCQPNTLRAKFLDYLRTSYSTEEHLDSLIAIDAPDIIETLWDVHSPDEIKQKRKNLSGLKSNLNKALKEAIDTGGNPEGIIISKDNVFIVSEEKKSLLLETLSILGGKDPIAAIISAIQALSTDPLHERPKTDISNLIEQLDNTRDLLSQMDGSKRGSSTNNDNENLKDIDDTEIIDGDGDGDKDSGGEGDLEAEDIDGITDDEWDSIEVDDDELVEVEEDGDEETSGDTGGELDSGGDDSEDEWDNIVVEEDFEEIDDDELVEGEEDGDEETSGDTDGELDDGDDDSGDEWDNIVVEDDFEEIDDDELVEVEECEDEETSGDTDGELDDGDGDSGDEWDNIVVEDDFEEIDDDELIEVEEDGDEETSGDTDGELDDGDGDSEDEWDNIVVEDDFEEIDDDELIEVEEDGDEETSGDTGGELDSGGDDSEDEWDNIVVEDDFEEIDDDELVEVEEHGDEETAGDTDGELDSGGDDSGDEWDNIVVEDDFEEIDDDELVEVEEDGDGEPSGNTDGELDDGDGDSEDEWDNIVIEDDLEEIDDDELVEVIKNNEAAPLSQSLDISQYIEPKEALDLGDVLQESNEEYVKQIIDRFMPKFIKIPKGTYSIGGPKKRSSDRASKTIELPSFFIGQHPITNDIFDFFIRETGYETEAEKEGYGLVTSNRLHGGRDKETGREIIVINQGISTTRVTGANWMHPCGPDSSLEQKGNHPVVQVSLQDALAFAAWAGKRLPSEDEWEVAARGKEKFLYPWGDQPEPLANLTESRHGTTSKVGLYGRLSLSPFGLLDMIGNVAEWTSSPHDKGHNLMITKGGSWANEKATCIQRIIEPKDTWTNTIGFRCCVNSPER